MLQRSLRLFPRFDKNYDEVKYAGRRLQLFPTKNPLTCRHEHYQDRFREVGPDFSRVWLSLGNKMRRRRVGRDRDFNDKRYYWRPIPAGIQRLYTKQFRRVNHSNRGALPPRLFPTAAEIGTINLSPLSEGKMEKRYGAEFAAPVPFDWEYRVY